MSVMSRTTAVGVIAALMVSGAMLNASVPANAGSPSVTPISRDEARQRPVLRRGDSGVWVRRLNRALTVSQDRKSFGAATAKAVIAFRVAHGMKPQPVVNVRTWIRLGSLVATGRPAAPVTPAPPVADRPELRTGDTSGWVQSVQVALGVQPASGYFGPLTLAAVKEFQQASGLPVTGIVDAATWQALGSRVAEPTIDVTTTDIARTSRAHRASIGVTAFSTSWTAQMVVKRESGGQCDVTNPSGKYRGKWQMDADFWSTYGGLEFAPTADQASCGEQDLVAYRGWVDRWWQPWPTAIP